jgi:hypothetical protein
MVSSFFAPWQSKGRADDARAAFPDSSARPLFQLAKGMFQIEIAASCASKI